MNGDRRTTRGGARGDPGPVPGRRQLSGGLGRRTPRRASSGSTTTCTSPTRSARCSSTSAVGGSPATTCSAVSGRPSQSTGWPRTSTATSTRPPSRPTRTCASTRPSTASRYGARVPRDGFFAAEMGKYLDTVLPVYGEHFADWWRDRLVPEMQRNFAYLEDRLDARDRDEPRRDGDPARGRDRHPRSSLEDPLDAQLRAAVGDAEPARGHGEDAGLGGRDAPRPAPELGLRSQLGLDRGALADEERGPRRRRAARGLRAGGRPRDRRRAALDRARPPVPRRADRPLPARVRLARRVEPRVHLPDRARGDRADPGADPRLPRDRLRLPDRDRRDAPDIEAASREIARRARGRGTRGAAGGQCRQPADGAADPGPPLLHRPGRQRARAARPARGRPEAGR